MDKGLYDLWISLEKAKGKQGFKDFLELNGQMAPDHIDPIVEVFYQSQYAAQKQLISLPPRFSKTFTTLYSIAYLLILNPKLQICYVTYNSTLATSKIKVVRDLVQQYGVKLRSDSKKVDEFITTEGGFVYACGIGSGITGRGFHLVCLDDSLKNRQEAESSTIRDGVYDFFTSSLLTRIEPNGSCIVIGTRWHQDDLLGRLEKDEEIHWNNLNLPALNEQNESLWPQRWSTEAILEKKKLVGEYDFASLFMGHPIAKGSALFKIDPKLYANIETVGTRMAIGVDVAMTANSKADYSVISVLSAKGSGIQQKVQVLDFWRGQVESPLLIKYLFQMQQKWSGVPIIIESTGGQKMVAQVVRNMAQQQNIKLSIVEVYPSADKFTRALPISAAWNNDQVELPSNQPWTKTIIQEASTFTGNDKGHDDIVDSLSMTYNYLNEAQVSIRRGVYAEGGNTGKINLWRKFNER